jgi:hypothetical protein
LPRSAETPGEKRVQEGRRKTGGSSRFRTLQKMQQFRRFACSLSAKLTNNRLFSAVFLQFRRDSYVKAHYFHFVKNRHLKASADGFRTIVPGANPRRGAREKGSY